MRVRLAAGLGSLALAACGSSSSVTAPEERRPLQIASVRELGAVGAPPSVRARDGGATALVGGRLLWTFGDTLFSPPAADGASGRSNTAGLADPSRPLELTEPVDARGAPFPFLPFTPEEQAYNDAGTGQAARIALWPGSVVPDGTGGGIVFYLKLIVNPGALNYDFLGTGLARVRPGQTTGTRDPGLIFNTPDPTFDDAAFLEGMLYVYGGLADGSRDLPVGVARAALAEAGSRAAYRFWTGTEWSADVRQTRRVFSMVPGGVTVSYNAYLRQFLAVHSGALTSRVMMRVADRPEGPWGEPVEAFTGLAPAPGTVDYAGREHPELSSSGGRTVIVSYYRPQASLRGELRLVEVTFR